MSNRSLIFSVAALGLILFSVADWFYIRPIFVVGNVPTEQSLALLRPHSPILGPADAPVTNVEFFDPACGTCRIFHPVLRDIMAQHGDEVRLAVRYMPLHGKGSEDAIRVLEAARMQGVYEPVLEAILNEQEQWVARNSPDLELILQIARGAGLDAEAARKQMSAPVVVATLNQDRADAETIGVLQTPTFFVNGRTLDTFGETELRALVAAEVAKSGS